MPFVARRNFYVEKNKIMLVVEKSKIVKCTFFGARPIPNNYEPCQIPPSTSHYNHPAVHVALQPPSVLAGFRHHIRIHGSYPIFSPYYKY